MKIGIDISQMAYEGTGVGEYTKQLVKRIVDIDDKNEYILLFINRKYQIENIKYQIKSKKSNFKIKTIRLPISWLEFFWNRLHVFPIEWFVGDVDVFLTSDWLEPPTQKARKVTTIHDLSIFKTPESFDKKIISVHKRKLAWVKKESNLIMCDTLATKKDVMDILGIEKERLKVVYPGI